MRRIVSFLLLTFLFTSCQTNARPRIFTPDGLLPVTDWTAEERAQDMAVRKIRATHQASYHLILLRGLETLHTHESHGLTVIMRTGKAKMTLGEQVFEMLPGDTVEIPRGVPHKAENLSKEASEVYAIFTPPFDGKDFHPVES